MGVVGVAVQLVSAPAATTPRRYAPRSMTYRGGAEERGGPIAPLEVEIGDASDSQFFADISGTVKGVFASTFLIFARDTPIDLVVALAPFGSFRARGSVLFVRGAAEGQLPGLGIVFTAIDPTDYATVATFGRDFRAPMLFDEA